MLKTIARRLVPETLRHPLRAAYYSCADSLEVLAGRRDVMTPPQRMNFVGYGDFRKIGEDFLRLSKELAGLQTDAHVLDVGCGIGRFAVPLTRYLDANGAYDGFDVVQEGIDWCSKTITRRHPNFRFQRVDLYNKAYNPAGTVYPHAFRFPYNDETFDFVILVSVFTHMLPADMDRYLAEIARVLKRGGTTFITYFVLNDESRRLLDAGKSTLDFHAAGDGFLTIDPDTPEYAVAYEEKDVRSRHEQLGLSVREPIHWGQWCGRESYVDYQDIVIADKV